MLRTDTETRENQLLKVHKKLTDDVLAADLQWSLMVSAQASYRHDTVLKPAPPMYTTDSDGSYDTEKLVCDWIRPYRTYMMSYLKLFIHWN